MLAPSEAHPQNNRRASSMSVLCRSSTSAWILIRNIDFVHLGFTDLAGRYLGGGGVGWINNGPKSKCRTRCVCSTVVGSELNSSITERAPDLFCYPSANPSTRKCQLSLLTLPGWQHTSHVPFRQFGGKLPQRYVVTYWPSLRNHSL